MKKFLILLLTVCLGTIANAAAPIKFIYLNGSNANTVNDKVAFTTGMNNTQEYVKSIFEASDFINEHLLKNGEYTISEKPYVFFWGYQSQEDLNNVNNCLLSMKMISPKLAQSVRELLFHCMHDAIWVQKSYHMHCVVNNLHRYVIKAYKNGEKVVLSGHSAGSFITYEYLIHKLPCITHEHLIKSMETTNNGRIDKFYQEHKIKPTCLDAITESGLALYTADGKFVGASSLNRLKEAYENLDEYTDLVCAPQDEVLGVINFGSPLVLFYSDIKDPNIAINQYNKVIFEYMKNNNMFFLTVNFADDPIGFPVSQNYTADELQNMNNLMFTDDSRGFIYNKSDVKSPATFVMAHSSYWKHPQKFAKAMRDAYIEGYSNFYPNN